MPAKDELSCHTGKLCHHVAMQHEPQPDSHRTLLQAIAGARMVGVTYNGTRMLLAPYQLFARNSESFLAALNPAKNTGDRPKELGFFKVSGLSEVELLDEGFDPLASFVGRVPRDGDMEILSVVPA